jgi:hypothetical protein
LEIIIKKVAWDKVIAAYLLETAPMILKKNASNINIK